MSTRSYNPPCGGLPPQSSLMTGRAAFTDAYVVIPKSVMSDIVTSVLPFWRDTQAWMLSRPLSGFSETFAQYLMNVAPGGGSDDPEPDPEAEGVLFVADGAATLVLDGRRHALTAGSYAYLAPGAAWTLRNDRDAPVRFHWIRKSYERAPGIDAPESFVTNETDIEPAGMPGADDAWATTRFVASDDVRHDMHVNIVSMRPGATIPFEETHVMEHGLFVLEGKAVYRLNRDWVEVEAGDFMWLRAFCPQACYAGGPGPFRYLLYKDVNRHAPLRIRAASR